MRRAGRLVAPAVVLAATQVAGRGRGQNVWWSCAGSITVTFVLGTDDQIATTHVPLLAGLAIRNAAAEICGDDAVALKWPNDLLHNGRKIAGLLCERVDGIDLIGVGFNLNFDRSEPPKALRDRVTSLSQIAGRAFDPAESLGTIHRHLRIIFDRARNEPPTKLLNEYESHHALIGRRLSVLEPGEAFPTTGRCRGIDSVGRLVLETPAGPRKIVAGHVMPLTP